MEQVEISERFGGPHRVESLAGENYMGTMGTSYNFPVKF
jgi:hypothetical protein